MNRIVYYLELTGISSILALLKHSFGTIQSSYIILLVLISIDTLTGMTVAIKYGRFNSKGLCKLLKKSITYTVAILTIKLLEAGILTLVDTNLLSQIIVAFLQVTESVSILENLTLLGVPLPSNFVTFLLKHIKIPGLSDALKLGRSNQKDISEIDNIISYQIPTFDDKNIRELLKIKFVFWKTIAYHIKTIFEDNSNSSKEHLHYKIMSIMEVELKDMKKTLKESDIPTDYITKFEYHYRPQVNTFLNEIEHICNEDTTLEKKRQKIIDKIIILSYETILVAHRIFNNS